MPWYLRIALAICGAGLVGLLVVAFCLEPSDKGFGTHVQLGLNPCAFTEIIGVRCPSCGMTTSWAHVVRGQFGSALQANSGGALLALVSAATGPWLLVSAAFGRWWLGKPNEWIVVAVVAFIVLVTLVDWAYRLNTL